MVIRAAPPPRAEGVVALAPQQSFDWLTGKLHQARTAFGELVALPPPWQPGQHFALLAKTREGKSNFAIWTLGNCRTSVLAADPKGGDETLARSGWPRLTGVPPRGRLPRELDEARQDGRPVRVIVGLADTRTAKADAANRLLMGEAIEYARQAGGYAVYVDEHQIMSHPRNFRLAPHNPPPALFPPPG